MPIVKLKGEFAMGDFDQYKYIQEYKNEKYYRPSILLPKDYKEKVKYFANLYAGGSVSRFVTDAIDEYIQKLESENQNP